MGVGGLLMEIVTRPQPRAEPRPEKGKRIAAIVLAAGRSTRMGGPNKLLAEIGGKPLVRIAAEQALASRARAGDRRHRPPARDASKQRSPGLAVRFVHNPDFAEGLVDLAEGRHRRRAGGGRRRDRLPRRHAAGRVPR